jgi:alpha-tubulin suppressor-like RCC1 family protein
MALGLVCGPSSHATAQAAGLWSARASAISAGGDHTCALLYDHRVVCWGYNKYGALGNGRRANSSTPVPVSGIANVSAIGAGGEETCALLFDHRVECWGNTDFEHLSRAKPLTNSTTPVVISELSNVTQVSPGEHDACALLYNHRAVCWGSNGWDELGSGKAYSSGSTPVPVKVITNAIALSVGYTHSCALLSSRRVKCWGGNNWGELGNGRKANSATPVPVKVITNATAISAGNDYTCALLSSRRVKCWGLNNWGELGIGNEHSSTPFSTPRTVKGIANATAIGAGGDHTCALLSDGTVKCWGYNDHGQLGNGKTTSSSIPVLVRGIANATAISVGYSHNCALLSGGTVKCWGYNGDGELGNRKEIDSSLPVTVIGLG